MHSCRSKTTRSSVSGQITTKLRTS
jgi:hypothetical protein